VSPEGGVSVSPLNQIFESDDNVTLLCETLGGPNNRFEWNVRRDGLTQGPSSPLFDLSPVQGGVYTCLVSNDAGVEAVSTTVYISIRFITQPNDTLASVRESIVLFCEAESFPDPTYDWFKFSSNIAQLVVRNSSQLSFNSVQFGDEGQYFCLATSRSNFTLASRTATLTGELTK